MARPHFKKSTDELEQLFRENVNCAGTLQIIAEELFHRKRLKAIGQFRPTIRFPAQDFDYSILQTEYLFAKVRRNFQLDCVPLRVARKLFDVGEKVEMLHDFQFPLVALLFGFFLRHFVHH